MRGREKMRERESNGEEKKSKICEKKRERELEKEIVGTTMHILTSHRWQTSVVTCLEFSSPSPSVVPSTSRLSLF